MVRGRVNDTAICASIDKRWGEIFFVCDIWYLMRRRSRNSIDAGGAERDTDALPQAQESIGWRAVVEGLQAEAAVALAVV